MKISKLKHVDPSWGYLELEGGSLVAMPKKAMKELQSEIKQLKKEVADYHQLQWQHDALIDENKRLKAENDEILNHCYDGVYEDNDRLEKENAKLRCFALHLFWKYAERLMWKCDGMSKCATTTPYQKDSYLRKCLRWEDLRNKCYKAYRKAKKALMEGK